MQRSSEIPAPGALICSGLSRDPFLRPGLARADVTGPDAASFLNGQFTADVQHLASGRWTWSGFCSAKGRLLATFRIARLPGGFVLQIPSAVAGDFLTRLRRFVLRAKVSLPAAATPGSTAEFDGRHTAADAIPGLDRWPGEGEVTEAGGCILFGVENGRVLAMGTSFDGVRDAAPGGEWRNDVMSGYPWILPGAQEMFVPQMVGLETVGGVSFTKGCYPGQEIVARSQYLGEVKRRLFRITASAARVPQPGETVSVASTSQPAGTVLIGSPADDSAVVALAVLDVRLGSADDLTLADGVGIDSCEAVHPSRE
ncbi:MAG: folate-binding protein YgfZ [Betaproteobacteria bacterium]|nr:folate-binding protein YgfZ [Betaproteobacteria bacterium]